jgi:hypothetical protein
MVWPSGQLLATHWPAAATQLQLGWQLTQMGWKAVSLWREKPEGQVGLLQPPVEVVEEQLTWAVAAASPALHRRVGVARGSQPPPNDPARQRVQHAADPAGACAAAGGGGRQAGALACSRRERIL